MVVALSSNRKDIAVIENFQSGHETENCLALDLLTLEQLCFTEFTKNLAARE
jgi:hypothetical protein